MRYDHDYEFAFNAFRPDFHKGQRNPYNYRLTGCFTTGDYWEENADNKEGLEAAMRNINRNDTILQNSIALQNKVGQLIWTREFGFDRSTSHPKYMDSMDCFDVNRVW